MFSFSRQSLQVLFRIVLKNWPCTSHRLPKSRQSESESCRWTRCSIMELYAGISLRHVQRSLLWSRETRVIYIQASEGGKDIPKRRAGSGFVCLCGLAGCVWVNLDFRRYIMSSVRSLFVLSVLPHCINHPLHALAGFSLRSGDSPSSLLSRSTWRFDWRVRGYTSAGISDPHCWMMSEWCHRTRYNLNTAEAVAMEMGFFSFPPPVVKCGQRLKQRNECVNLHKGKERCSRLLERLCLWVCVCAGKLVCSCDISVLNPPTHTRLISDSPQAVA